MDITQTFYNQMAADGTDTVQLTIELLDGKDRPAEDETVYCQVLGNCTLLGLENGRPDDLTPYPEIHRMTREGTLTAYFRGGEIRGEGAVHVWTAAGLQADWKCRFT